MKPIRIVVVDDHPLFRQGVIDSISLEADCQVVGEAATGEEALATIRKLEPTVAVMDINLPDINGQMVTRQLMNERISTRFILLTAYDDSDQQLQSIRAGASAYCTKDVQPEMLARIVREVAGGRYVIGAHILDEQSLERWLVRLPAGSGFGNQDNQSADTFQPLSGREMEVLVYITRGLSNKEIACKLKISHQTVKNHVTSILHKLGVEDRTQATIFALRRGWVRLYQSDIDSQE